MTQTIQEKLAKIRDAINYAIWVHDGGATPQHKHWIDGARKSLTLLTELQEELKPKEIDVVNNSPWQKIESCPKITGHCYLVAWEVCVYDELDFMFGVYSYNHKKDRWENVFSGAVDYHRQEIRWWLPLSNPNKN